MQMKLDTPPLQPNSFIMVNGLVGVGSTERKAKEDARQQNYLEPNNIEIQTVRESSKTLALATPI